RARSQDVLHELKRGGARPLYAGPLSEPRAKRSQAAEIRAAVRVRRVPADERRSDVPVLEEWVAVTSVGRGQWAGGRSSKFSSADCRLPTADCRLISSTCSGSDTPASSFLWPIPRRSAAARVRCRL